MQDEITVSFKYNQQDIINFVLDAFSFEKVRCTLFLIFNISTFVTGLIFLIFLQNIPIGIFCLGISFLVFPLTLLLTYKASERSLQILTQVICTLKENGLNFISNLGETLISFDEIKEVKLTEQLIFVYISKHNALVIPKRVFKSKESEIDFSAKLIERVKLAKNK